MYAGVLSVGLGVIHYTQESVPSQVAKPLYVFAHPTLSTYNCLSLCLLVSVQTK